jgi:hypothetical protein
MNNGTMKHSGILIRKKEQTGSVIPATAEAQIGRMAV